MQRFFDTACRPLVLLPGTLLAHGPRGPGNSSLFEIK